jgi:hypothetical protein
MSVKVCSNDQETLGNILSINSPDNGRKAVEGGLTWGSAEPGRLLGTTSFSGKISRSPPKAVVKVSMLRDARNHPIPPIKGGGEPLIQHMTRREQKSSTPRRSPTFVVLRNRERE